MDTTAPLEPQAPQVFMPDLTATSFTGISGKTYYILKSITTGRYALAEQYQIEFFFGSAYMQQFNLAKGAYLDLNQHKLADAAVKLDKILQGVVNIENKEVPAAKFCTLFMVEEGEDLSTITEAQIEAKLKDWAAIDVRFFFQHITSSTPGFREGYTEVLSNSLKLAVEQQPETT